MKSVKRIFSLIICMIILSTTAFASEYDLARTNSYISRTRATIDVIGNGQLSIGFNISGKGKMDKIGATAIYLYENDGTSTRIAQTFQYTDLNYSHLMGFDAYYHSGNVSYTGTQGYTYYATVYFEAENS